MILLTPGEWLGGNMRHSWIFEVLSDLRAYAVANDLPRLAGKTAEAEVVAQEEIAQTEIRRDLEGD